MRVNSTQETTGRIIIEDDQNHEVFSKPVKSTAELKEFLTKYGNSYPEWSWGSAAIIPVRTDQLNHFFEDLIFPTFINHALNINNFILRFFLSLAALIFDAITLPLRLVTAPVRILYNCCQNDHPLLELIKNESKDAKITGIFKLKVTLELIKYKEGVDVIKVVKEGEKEIAVRPHVHRLDSHEKAMGTTSIYTQKFRTHYYDTIHTEKNDRSFEQTFNF